MEGSCACGAVTYTCGAPVTFVNCHCTLCRRINGAAFSSYVVVRSDAFVVSGKHSLAAYAASDRSTKHYCGACGTPIYNTNPSTYPGLSMLYLGTVAQAGELEPGINIFCDSKLQWVDGISVQKSFAQTPQRGA